MAMSYAADLLQNPDFESPPTNVTANATSQLLLLLTRANSIPGWSFNGTIWYATSGGNLSLPGNGHAVQLGENGRINQTFKAVGDVLDYVLTFTLAAQNENCANNHTASIPPPAGLWSIRLLSQEKICPDGNILANGGFEIGPAFLKNSNSSSSSSSSSGGVVLNEEAERFESPLQEWAIMGTIRYIDSKHYKVPQGKAAIQLLSGDPSGVHIDLNFPLGSAYKLNFTIGDANDSCVGYFIVYLQIGNQIMNFTMQSNGTGSAFNHDVSFNSESSGETSISFYSFNETRRRSDGVLCGPVLDNIIINALSYGSRIQLYKGLFMFTLCFAFIILLMKASTERPPTPDEEIERDREQTLEQIVSVKLLESGEKERLKELLREKLVECGWRDEMKALCREFARKKGRNNVSVDELIEAITPKGRASVPDAVKTEMLQRIHSVVASTKEGKA
ncbi:hypothetical protein ACJIZ3_004595 [Penstemon smallii]|uniref:Transcription and mRNA export factor ENY2 n=1 Tax=Penstemon smallii TaxID=265156 RepID=A0ABD3S2I7_9LAMI